MPKPELWQLNFSSEVPAVSVTQVPKTESSATNPRPFRDGLRHAKKGTCKYWRQYGYWQNLFAR